MILERKADLDMEDEYSQQIRTVGRPSKWTIDGMILEYNYLWYYIWKNTFLPKKYLVIIQQYYHFSYRCSFSLCECVQVILSLNMYTLVLNYEYTILIIWFPARIFWHSLVNISIQNRWFLTMNHFVSVNVSWSLHTHLYYVSWNENTEISN